MTKLIECIPNFSEARRPAVVDEIAAAIQSVPGARLLDRSSDLDHNRTVLTFAGTPKAVEQAAFQAIQKAAQLIDLNEHTGEHPRIGATDVVPFVPLSGVSMDECVAMARHLGERVGKELNIPVYLYEKAATRPERENLENIRRGQYEGLKAEIETDPNRVPDFGPAKLGPAGATVIGARSPLIAFNVYLTTGEVDIAKKIAKAVRHSSGGLRFVKALGLLVEGRAQVSMNLTDFHQTPVARVVEFVRREAERYGVGIHHSELVGLIPQQALTEAAVWYTQLDAFSPDQVLETRLYAESDDRPSTEDRPTGDYKTQDYKTSSCTLLDDLAAPTPAPGGGSAAAYAAAMGAALVSMVAGLTQGRKKYAEVEAEMQAIRHQSEKLRKELTHTVDDDAAAFEAVMGAYQLPKETPEQQQARDAAIQMATINATHIPLHVAEHAVRVIDLAARCAESGNRNAISDAASGAALARAALTAAGYNVRINVAGLQDPAPGQPFLEQLREFETRAAGLEAKLRSVLETRGGMSF
jgi:glutamate formiminotransferase/formiminotetrahydrofolate cyclodeaminase